MPVQAQPRPSSGEPKIRASPHFGAPGFLVSNPSINRTAMDDFQQQQLQFFLGAPVSDPNMHRVIPHGASPMLPVQEMVPQNVMRTYRPVPAMVAGALECVDNIPTVDNSIGGARKRRKELSEMGQTASHAQPEQVHLQQMGVDLNQTLATSFPPTLVSTGLRLAFDDERSTVTSSRTSACRPSFSLRDELSARFSSHQEDLNRFLKAQADQLRQALGERIESQAKSLMASVESEVARKMREKEAEMEGVGRRNAELEDRVRQLSMEREVWQSKARSSETTVAILRGNLQQAMVQVQQHQSRDMEGCGDSEADDAGSVYMDDNLTAKQSRARARARAMMMRKAMMKGSHMELVRVCRQCGACEASVLLLPCLHLCLCLQCSSQSKAVEKCPVCSTAVSNMAEVLLS